MAIFVVAMIGVGCAPARDQGVERASADKPYDLRSEGEIPPPVEVAPEADVEEVAIEEVPLEVGEAEAPIDTTDAGPETLDGYRVQLFASIKREAAEEARRVAEAKLGMVVYVEVIERMYKVRVGDCLTRECAEGIQHRCREAGYPDAWIVGTQVHRDRAEAGTDASE